MENKKYQLPREFATKLIKALNSGEYKQGRSSLFKDGCFCVHGVIMDLSGIPLYLIKQGLYARDIECRAHVDLVEMGLPKQLHDSRLEDELMCLNDQRKLSFSQIGEWITENVEFI